jgi:hypothetical protein
MRIETTKPAAALRMITAAIQMEKMQIDPMAVMVVAASAFNMLREILKKRGATFESRALRLKIWAISKGMVDKEGPWYDAVSEEIDQIIEHVSKKIKSGDYSEYMDIEINATKEYAIWMLSPIYKPYNFLKHADRDMNNLIDENSIEVSDTIMMAIQAYCFVFTNELPPEPLKSYFKNWVP